MEVMLGPLETEVMGLVWAANGPVSVREIVGGLNEQRRDKLAYTTVMTVMARLAEKGVLTRVREGRGYRYEPVASDEAGLAVRDVLQEFGDAALAHFVDQARADPKTLRRLQKLLGDD
jgi:BlaI family transcriptional regulator, penicillinase repressor